jgi:hypothetical protein
VSGRRQEPAEAQRDRLKKAFGAAETDDHDRADAEQEEKAWTRMTVMPHIGSGVTNAADHRGDRDDRPFEAFVRKVMQAENW